MSDTKRNRAIVKRVAAGTSIKAVADEFGITKQRVSQIHISLTGERQPKPDPGQPNAPRDCECCSIEDCAPLTIALQLGVSRYAVLGKIYRLRQTGRN